MPRLPIAFLISIALNVVLFAVDFSIDPRQEKLTRVQHSAVVLLRPAEELTMRLASGHGGGQIAASVAFSIPVSAIASWVALSLPAWWRNRA